MGAGRVWGRAPSRARAQADRRRRLAGRTQRGEEHAAVGDLRRAAQDRRLPLHHARAPPGRRGALRRPFARDRGHSGNHRGSARRQGTRPPISAARRTDPDDGRARPRRQSGPAGHVRAAAAGGGAVFGRSGREAARGGAEQVGPAPRSPLPAPGDPYAGRRAGGRRLRRHARRDPAAPGDPVATASGASRDELAAYLALAQLPGIGAVRLGTLTAAFQSAAAALQAPHGAIAALPGFGRAAATAAGAASLGVLGNGFGVVYPAANRPLYERMITHGCLVTELPPGERPRARTFPRRNRLISGLAGVTVVVEAAAGSGALITVDCALDQGRGVLAVPGPITSPTSLGCNRLIQQGAKPALCAADILEELGVPAVTPAAASTGTRATPPDLGPLQRKLWDALGAEPQHVDALVALAGAAASARSEEHTSELQSHSDLVC